jgi:hypothetical protein
MELVRRRVTISFNRAHVGFASWGFFPTYYACIDRIALEDNAADIAALAYSGRIQKVFLRDGAPRQGIANSDRVCLVHVTDSPLFSTDLRQLGMFDNVAAVSIQILAACGYRRIVLLGVDGYYRPQPLAQQLDRPWKLRATQDNDPNHFVANYHGAGRRFTRPNPEKYMRGWRALAEQLPATGIQVVNCTPGTAVDCLPVWNLERGLRWLDGQEEWR